MKVTRSFPTTPESVGKCPRYALYAISDLKYKRLSR
jgi:hypothetical protein